LWVSTETVWTLCEKRRKLGFSLTEEATSQIEKYIDEKD